MPQENETKTVAYVVKSGSFALSDNLRRVVDSISSNSVATSAASKAFDKQLSNYVRAQG